MNAIIYVFSGTGNTKKICTLYKDEFEKHGVETTLYAVRSDMSDLPNPMDFDLVGFAYPIHAFNAPKIMLKLAKAMPKVAKKEIFILKSSGEPLKVNNVSSLKFMSIMKKKGYALKSEYHYVMPYDMIFRHTDREAVRMWDAAQKLCPVEAREVLDGKEHKLSRIFMGRFIAWVLRIEHPAMLVNGRCFKVKKDKCIMCHKCEKNCPVGNIKIDENGKFHFGGDCLMCTRCSFGCPTDAFSIGILNAWRINGAYPMDKPVSDDVPEPKHHHWYCKRAYQRYFESAERKTAQLGE